MTTLGLIAELPTTTDPQRMMPIREAAAPPAPFRGHGAHEEQIQALLQQLFFRQDPALLRHVGFAAADSENPDARPSSVKLISVSGVAHSRRKGRHA